MTISEPPTLNWNACGVRMNELFLNAMHNYTYTHTTKPMIGALLPSLYYKGRSVMHNVGKHFFNFKVNNRFSLIDIMNFARVSPEVH